MMKYILRAIISIALLCSLSADAQATSITTSGLWSCNRLDETLTNSNANPQTWTGTSTFSNLEISYSNGFWNLLDFNTIIATAPGNNLNPPANGWTGTCAFLTLSGSGVAATTTCLHTTTAGGFLSWNTYLFPTTFIASTSGFHEIVGGNAGDEIIVSPSNNNSFFAVITDTANNIMALGIVSANSDVSYTVSLPGNYRVHIFDDDYCATTSPNIFITLETNRQYPVLVSGASGLNNESTVEEDSLLTDIVWYVPAGYQVTGLPTGVTYAHAGYTLTISGYPYYAGTYNYSINYAGWPNNYPPDSGIITVLERPSAFITNWETNAVCQGSSTTLKVNITGGVPPYTVTLTNGITPATIFVSNYLSNESISFIPDSTRSYSLVSVRDSLNVLASLILYGAIPKVSVLPCDSICAGDSSAVINFANYLPSYSDTIYKWTNDNPSIGLPASGTGDIPSFTALNTGTTPVVANITVTPQRTFNDYAFIPNSVGNTVSVFNRLTNALITNIPVGNFPYGVAVHSYYSRAYVTNVNSNSLSIINTTTNTVIQTLQMGYSPKGVCVSQDGFRVYVANSGIASNNVSVINAYNNTVIATIPVGSEPTGIAVSRDGNWVYVTNKTSNSLSIINASTNSVVGTVLGLSSPEGVVVSPDGSRVYVSNSNYVSIIQTSTNTLLQNVTLASTLYQVIRGLCINADGSRLYVAKYGPNIADNGFYIINPTDLNNITIASIGYSSPITNYSQGPQGVSISPDGNTLYVVNSFSRDVLVWNTTTLQAQVKWSLPISSFPYARGNFITSTIKAASVTFTLTVKPSPSVTATAVPNATICAGESLFLAGSGSSAYTWTGGITDSVSFTPMASGSYVVTGTDGNSCTNTSTMAITVSNTIGNLALATNPNVASIAGWHTKTKDQPNDGQLYNYNDANCNLIASLQENAGGLSLGAVTCSVTVEANTPFYNGQPYIARWYDISPTNQGPANVTLYFTDDDFISYNANNGSFPDIATNANGDTVTTNLALTKTNGALGTVTPTVINATAHWNVISSRWEVTFPVSGFSQFRLHAQNPGNAALPIEYKNFNVRKSGSTDLVEWITLNETNNKYFNIQRSANGQDFINLGRVKTKATNGISTTELSYNFVDERPQIGHNYYRLEQVDTDEKKSYSKVINIFWVDKENVLSIYPNPTKDRLNVDVTMDNMEAIEVRLLDMSGRVVKSIMHMSREGLNNISIDLSNVASGIYGLQLYENNKLIHVDKVRKND